MNFISAMNISASGLTAQRTRMNIVSMNLSQMHTTRTKTGEPYRRKIPIFTATPMTGPFGRRLKESLDRKIEVVEVTNIVADQKDFKTVFDPSHPDADEFGYVRLPNVNLMEEMVHMLTAQRSYEANIVALNAAKNMALKSLELIK
ncbi:MAG: flagellar basal body rod protein FlgC [Deltaproteobacteria bacterium]|nr:flagellar basal body rod protein FlgC [Deltaproteobacteria bacterium]MBW2052667.1 flagellar basal body rod protein FlgC [Deltaproteobacteria bacterium]MBW2141354.1 flagellar basal body rod protein FlgC [Deltaproteobacteria bacterium]MBW2322743.1 flagellar basal body rod protein FlgC [Deltaproteobacteria bacterium]